MSRLTTDKPVEKMGMYELAHNSCYTNERLARYRDFDRDIDTREFARELMVSFGLWKSCELYGADADNELVDDDIFDDTMIENLAYEPTTAIGLIALFYRNLWAMADLHSKLKYYEDLEEQGRLVVLPCKVGDTVYLIDFEEEEWEEATVDEIVITDERIEINSDYEIGTSSECDYIAYSEAEARIMLEMWKLAELKGTEE